MQIIYATESTPQRANEDLVMCGPDWAVVLDGATAPHGVESGCIHGVRWLVRQLAAALSRRMLLGTASLTDVLASAIRETRDAHAGTCDVSNPESPSTTVAMYRASNHKLEYLTLGDSPIVISHPGKKFELIKDPGIDGLANRGLASPEHARSLRNTPGGFWMASTVPEAAQHAVAGALSLYPGMEIGLFTDGVTRLAEYYDYCWEQIFSILRLDGPAGLIKCVRSAERAAPPAEAKKHDDATAVYVMNI